MAGLTREHARVIDYLEAQGATATRTTKGLMFRGPDGQTATLHWTESDWRSTRNFRANIRRMGLQYPGERPAKAKPVMETTRKRVLAAIDALESRGEPVTTTALCVEAKSNTATVQNAMVDLGWWHEYRKPNRRGTTITWLRPLENPTEILEPLPTSLEDQPPAPQAAVSREFLDTVDSWTSELDRIDQSTTVAQLRALYAATGLSVELRVWRTPVK
jgi:hypothetical protein